MKNVLSVFENLYYGIHFCILLTATVINSTDSTFLLKLEITFIVLLNKLRPVLVIATETLSCNCQILFNPINNFILVPAYLHFHVLVLKDLLLIHVFSRHLFHLLWPDKIVTQNLRSDLPFYKLLPVFLYNRLHF